MTYPKFSNPMNNSPGLNSENPKKSERLPGEEGVWVFILGDMVVFALFFAVFAYYRSLDIQLYKQSQSTLDQNYAAFNTLLLLTSSWFVVLALHEVRKNKTIMARLFFASGLLCGVGFALVKILEYREKIQHGITMMTNDFYMYYYIFTGNHFLHVIIGLSVLMFLLLKTKQDSLTIKDIQTFESGAAYWHMVDLLWIVFFPLLYLVK